MRLHDLGAQARPGMDRQARVKLACHGLSPLIAAAAQLDYITDQLGAASMEIGLSKAKARLSELAARADRGEEVVITRRGRSPLRLVADHRPLTAEEKATVLANYYGILKGRPDFEGVTGQNISDFLYDENGLPA